jgi:hypothetical protein
MHVVNKIMQPNGRFFSRDTNAAYQIENPSLSILYSFSPFSRFLELYWKVLNSSPSLPRFFEVPISQLSSR